MRDLHPLLVALLAVAFATTARAAEPKRLVVLPLDVRDAQLDVPTQHVLQESIRAAAGAALSTSGYVVLNADETAAALPELPEKACDATCLVNAARKLQTQLYIAGSVAKSEGAYVVYVKLFDSATSGQLAFLEIDKPTIRDVRQELETRGASLFVSVATPPVAAALPSPAAVPAPPAAEPPPPNPDGLDWHLLTVVGFPRSLHLQLGATFARPLTVEVVNGGRKMRCPSPLSPTVACDLRPVVEGRSTYTIYDGKTITTEGFIHVPPLGAGLKLTNAGSPRWVNTATNWGMLVGIGSTLIGAVLWGVGSSTDAPIGKPGPHARTVGEVLLPVGVAIGGSSLLIRALTHEPVLEPLQPGDPIVNVP